MRKQTSPNCRILCKTTCLHLTNLSSCERQTGRKEGRKEGGREEGGKERKGKGREGKGRKGRKKEHEKKKQRDGYRLKETKET